MSTEQAARDAERIPLLVLRAFIPKKGQVQRGAYASVHRVTSTRGDRRTEHINWSAVPFGEVSIATLAERLGVSTTTVQRHKRIEQKRREGVGEASKGDD